VFPAAATGPDRPFPRRCTVSKFLSLLIAVALVVGLCGVPVLAAEETPEDVYKKLDANSDGKVSLEEYTAGKEGKKKENAEKQFKKLDANSDGALSLEEFKAGQKKPKAQ
jgi:Ca2+-binding EF-hand superfamily protein